MFFILIFWNRIELQETYEQCLKEVPMRFIIGSVNGQFISSMKKLTQEIIPLAFNNQFQEPKITNSILFEPDEHHHGDRDEVKANQNIECSIDFTYTSRPSDFRIKSICDGKTLEFVEHNSDRNDEQQQQQRKQKQQLQQKPKTSPTTGTAAQKSIRKLFDEFIVDFNASIERYCVQLQLHSLS